MNVTNFRRISARRSHYWAQKTSYIYCKLFGGDKHTSPSALRDAHTYVLKRIAHVSFYNCSLSTHQYVVIPWTRFINSLQQHFNLLIITNQSSSVDLVSRFTDTLL